MTTSPKIAKSIAKLHRCVGDLRAGGKRIALVPTMGALHDGHAALIDEAHHHADAVVVSIFVNPLQFGPNEDFDRYPRPFDNDVKLAGQYDCDVVFAPSVDELYPQYPPAITIDPGSLANQYEGASRPGHFRGVLTVVAKLFTLVRPDVAMFGEKDFQQLALVRRMVADLNFPLEIVGVPIVRDADGLARSSRNAYLSDADRGRALALSKALMAGAAAAAGGPMTVLAAARRVLDQYNTVEVDYLALTDPNLGPTKGVGEARLLIAARVGGTRLIDNYPIHFKGSHS